MINKLGVVGRSSRNKANMDPLDGEMLELFEKQFRAAVFNVKPDMGNLTVLSQNHLLSSYNPSPTRMAMDLERAKALKDKR